MKTAELIIIKCVNCGQRSAIDSDETMRDCPECGGSMILDPPTTETRLGMESPNILNETFRTINSERQDQYGKPEDNFQIIAEFWTTYLNKKGWGELSTLDIAHMMTLFKIARMLGQKPNRDNYRDACGYLAIAADRLIRWPVPSDPEEL